MDCELETDSDIIARLVPVEDEPIEYEIIDGQKLYWLIND